MSELVANDLDRAADELERIGWVEDPDRRRAIQRGIAVLRTEATEQRIEHDEPEKKSA